MDEQRQHDSLVSMDEQRQHDSLVSMDEQRQHDSLVSMDEQRQHDSLVSMDEQRQHDSLVSMDEQRQHDSLVSMDEQRQHDSLVSMDEQRQHDSLVSMDEQRQHDSLVSMDEQRQHDSLVSMDEQRQHDSLVSMDEQRQHDSLVSMDEQRQHDSLVSMDEKRQHDSLVSMDEQRHPVGIQLLGVMQKAVANLYMTTVLWSDQNEITVYRSLEDFKMLHRQLKKKFPPSNPIRRSGRIIPRFKAARVQKNMQKWNPSKSVLRLKALNEYCSELLKSDPRICQSSELIQFLLPKPQDLDSDFAKNSIMIMPSEYSLSSGNVGMNNVTQPFVTESYRCIATYETKNTKNLPFKVEVDEIVDVLIKDQKGWWLVENEAKHLAWFPAPYLKRAEMDDDGPDVMDDGSVFYVVTKSYKAMNSDELSVEIGSVVEVLQKSDNGWWIVRYNRKEGFVPSMYLQPYNKPQMHLMPAKREITSSTLDLAQLQHPGENFLQVSGRELSRSQGNLRPPGSTLDPKDKQMSRSLSRLPDAHTTRLTPPSVRVEFVENGPQSSLSDDRDNDSSFSGSDSLNRSDTEEQLRRSRTPTPDSSGSLSPKSAEGGKMISSRSDPSLNKMPSTPKIPPRPQAQEILKRCTTVTRKNLQRTS